MLEGINLQTNGEKSLRDDYIVCFGDITYDTAANVVDWILRNNLNLDDKPDVLTLFLNSAGGDLSAAWSIIDVIRGSSIPVRIIGLGQIASAGLLIFSAGKKGYRILTENTSIMSHQYFWCLEGKHHELLAAEKEVNMTQDRLLKYFRKVTGLTNAQITQYLIPPTNVYMSAQEAKDLGICDIIHSLK